MNWEWTGGSVNRSCVVTGVAAGGIGHAVALKLAESGFHVFGSVRRPEDADAFKAAFGDAATPLLFDVTNQADVRKAAAAVADAIGRTNKLAGLVNNAGIATPGPLLHLPLDDFRRQLEINTIGQLGVVQAFAPLLGADRHRQRKCGAGGAREQGTHAGNLADDRGERPYPRPMGVHQRLFGLAGTTGGNAAATPIC